MNVEYGVMKPGLRLPMTRELLLDHGLVKPTAEEQAEAERASERYRLIAADRAQRLAVAKRKLAALDDPLSRAILDLHAEDERHECQGCDVDGYEAESPPWPCRTVEAVAAHHGIDTGGPTP